MVSGMLKSLPPCSLKPHGAGPLRLTVYVELIFASKRHSVLRQTSPSLCSSTSHYEMGSPARSRLWSSRSFCPLALIRIPSGVSCPRASDRPVCSLLSGQTRTGGGGLSMGWVGWVRCSGNTMTHKHTHAQDKT